MFPRHCLPLTQGQAELGTAIQALFNLDVRAPSAADNSETWTLRACAHAPPSLESPWIMNVVQVWCV